MADGKFLFKKDRFVVERPKRRFDLYTANSLIANQSWLYSLKYLGKGTAHRCRDRTTTIRTSSQPDFLLKSLKVTTFWLDLRQHSDLLPLRSSIVRTGLILT